MAPPAAWLVSGGNEPARAKIPQEAAREPADDAQRTQPIRIPDDLRQATETVESADAHTTQHIRLPRSLREEGTGDPPATESESKP
jgi:hypothetical protein